MSKKVSVITSTRNRESFLPSLFAQFDRQTYDNKELIIFDDSKSPCPFFSTLNDERVKYIHSNEPKTTGEARNFLTQQASGEIVAIFDDDDVYLPKYLEGMISKLGNNDLIKLDGWYIYKPIEKALFYWDTTINNEWHFHVGGNPTTTVSGDRFDNTFIDRNKYGYGFSYVFLKSAAKNIRFDTEWNADYCFVRALMDNGGKVITIPSSYEDQDYVIHMIHGANCSSTFPQKQIHNLQDFDLGAEPAPQFSACIIVKNEEVVLPKLLNSLRNCSDVVVLDTGSVDKTIEIAKSFPNVRLETFKWTNSFAEARNKAASYAVNEWIAWLDADFWFPEGEIEKINSLLPKLPENVDSISLKIVDIATGCIFPSPRIYRKHLQFTGDVHEDISCKMSCATPFIVNHERTELPGAREKKDARYLKILHAEYEKNPKSLHCLMYLRDASFNSKDYEMTRKYCSEQLALEQDYLCYYYRARIFFDQDKNFKEALNNGFKALEICPFDPRVYIIIADTYDEMGKKIEALTWYEHAMKLPSEARLSGTKYAVSEDEYTVIPLVNQAKVYVDMGLKEKALNQYNQALALCPNTIHRPGIETNIKAIGGNKQNMVAAFTTTRNDPWLWLWLSYYSSQIGEENCYLLYEPNDKRSLKDKERFPKANWIELPNPYIDKFPKEGGYCSQGEYVCLTETWRCKVVYEWQEKLLKNYQCVIFGDGDEVLVPPEGILNYCKDKFLPSGKDRVRSCCWQPVHIVDGEPPIKFESGEKILENRNVMWRLDIYHKTLLVRKPQHYCKGYHVTTGIDGTGQQDEWYPELRYRVNDPISTDLPMLHLWRTDFDLWYNERNWQWGVDKETALAYFRDHKARWIDDNSIHANGDPQLIPQVLKDLLVLK